MTSTTENHKEAGGSGRRPFDAGAFECFVVALIAAVVVGYGMFQYWIFERNDRPPPSRLAE